MKRVAIVYCILLISCGSIVSMVLVPSIADDLVEITSVISAFGLAYLRLMASKP